MASEKSNKSDGAVNPSAKSKEKDLKTEGPLSEKDEVKNAERNMAKRLKKKP
jgi:hypothetical protein